MPGPGPAPAGVLALTALATPLLTRRLRRTQRAPVAEAVIADPPSSTSLDDLTGAVRSVQAADIFLPTQALHQIWSPAHLERLAREKAPVGAREALQVRRRPDLVQRLGGQEDVGRLHRAHGPREIVERRRARGVGADRLGPGRALGATQPAREQRGGERRQGEHPRRRGPRARHLALSLP